jgi:hypothetical protein
MTLVSVSVMSRVAVYLLDEMGCARIEGILKIGTLHDFRAARLNPKRVGDGKAVEQLGERRQQGVSDTVFVLGRQRGRDVNVHGVSLCNDYSESGLFAVLRRRDLIRFGINRKT